MKPIIPVTLLLCLFSSTTWNMDGENSNSPYNVPRPQPPTEEFNGSLLDKFRALFSETEPIQDIEKYDLKLSTHKLSRRVLFDDLYELSRLWICREENISIFIHFISHIHLNFCHHYEELLSTLDDLGLKMNGLIKTLGDDLAKLSNDASDIATEYSIKNMPNLGGLDNLFNPSVISMDDYRSTKYYVLFNCLCEATALYELFIRLESIFIKFKHGSDQIKKNSSDLSISAFPLLEILYFPMEDCLRDGKKVTNGIFQSQKLYLSIYLLLRDNFSEEDVKTYKKARIEIKGKVNDPPLTFRWPSIF